MGSFQINSSTLSIPDPSGWEPDGLPENGTFYDGAPLYQGYESGVVVWTTLTQTQYDTLYDAWNAVKGTLVHCHLPPEEGTSYRGVSAYVHAPLGPAVPGNLRGPVRMRFTGIR